MENMEDLKDVIDKFCENKGLEAYPFKLKWYNASLTCEKFRIQTVPEDSLAFVIISQPSMFERTFLPFMHENWKNIDKIGDPLDQCMKNVFQNLVNQVQHLDPDVQCFHDFELGPNRRPKVLVQTAGHVAGAVRFYQEKDANPELLEKQNNNSKIYPVCLHPQFGGWFALRGIFIFPSFNSVPMSMGVPPEILDNPDDIAHLLNLYNHHWRDSRFRNFGPVQKKYSQEQQNYFALSPGSQRNAYLSELLSLDIENDS